MSSDCTYNLSGKIIDFQSLLVGSSPHYAHGDIYTTIRRFHRLKLGGMSRAPQ